MSERDWPGTVQPCTAWVTLSHHKSPWILSMSLPQWPPSACILVTIFHASSFVMHSTLLHGLMLDPLWILQSWPLLSIYCHVQLVACVYLWIGISVSRLSNISMTSLNSGSLSNHALSLLCCGCISSTVWIMCTSFMMPRISSGSGPTAHSLPSPSVLDVPFHFLLSLSMTVLNFPATWCTAVMLCEMIPSHHHACGFEIV